MAPPQQQPQGDNSLAALWITLFFAAFIAAVGYFFHNQLVALILWVKYGELLFLSLFTVKYQALEQLVLKTPASQVSWWQVWQITHAVGNGVRYIFIPILLMLAGTLFYTHPSFRFKKTYGMKTLLEQEKFNWPQIMPVTTIDLVKEPLEKGPWAMAMTPLQFVKKNQLFYEERDTSQVLIGNQREKITVGLLRAQAYQVFAVQTGAAWMGVERLPMHAKALFAIFAARANRDADNAKILMDQLSVSSVTGHLDFTGVEELVKKYQDTSEVKKVLSRHAFVLTVMASMLEIGREDGVIASAEFLWLKLVDRPLWYMLNAVGRQTPPAEIAGAFAHWIAEKKLGRAINVPLVDEAVKALENALQEVVYVPDEER